MLNKNIVEARKRMGLTQEALAVKLNVVRQTVSKWERGEAVPDADMLCRLADALEVNVTALLGQTQSRNSEGDGVVQALASINEQLAIRNRRARRIWRIVLAVLLSLIAVIAVLFILNVAVKSDIREASSVSVAAEEQVRE